MHPDKLNMPKYRKWFKVWGKNTCPVYDAENTIFKKCDQIIASTPSMNQRMSESQEHLVTTFS